MASASDNALSQRLRRNVSLAHFCTTSLQPRAVPFSSVLHKVEMLEMRRGRRSAHTYCRCMYQRPVGVRGGEYAHLNQDKQAYFINQLFIIEYISAINYLAGVASFFLRPKTGLRAVYLGATFLDLFPQYQASLSW